ncbi:MAG: response regulator [Coleofasciculaceae cyanobacterium]
MTINQVLTSSEIAKQIQVCSQKKFTGLLIIQEGQGQQWSLHFYLGSLTGASSEVHSTRRWCRQLSKYCPILPVETICNEPNRSHYCDYNSLLEMMVEGTIEREQVVAVVRGNITEILFDIIQQGEKLRRAGTGKQLTYRQIPQDNPDSSSILIQAEQAWQQAIKTWLTWQQAGLGNLSPNLAPLISQAQELQRQTSPLVYDNLTTLADGSRTLRDLAVKLKQNLLPLTKSIIPYISKGLICLKKVEDFSCAFKPPSLNVSVQSVPPPSRKLPLVTYIDDNRFESQMMGQILRQAGYQFINIQDSVQALPILLEHKPDLIFLDLVMPLTNGYEVCTQIRRISMFKDTPVIILTGNDGIVDRVRAKMVGSTGFLAKPIEQEKVLAVLQRYLPVKMYRQNNLQLKNEM